MIKRLAVLSECGWAFDSQLDPANNIACLCLNIELLQLEEYGLASAERGEFEESEFMVESLQS